MNKPYPEQVCEPDRRQSPTEEAFNEIGIALKILSEAVERMACRTSDVRASQCLPCDPKGNDTIPQPPTAPIVYRLRDIKMAICAQADNLNILSDEIQL